MSINAELGARIGALAEKIRQDWHIPGLALSIVQGQDIVLTEGYGQRTIGHTEPVTADTLFGIASCTKSFTAFALGLLVDEGHLQWDDPVVRHLPDFALPEAWMTEQATVRDLLAHRLGLQRATPLYISGKFSQAELIYKMRHYTPLVGFRSEFTYDNAQYTTAGALVQAISGQTWSDFITERIFKPLNMHRSSTSYQHAMQTPNRSAAHTLAHQGLLTNSSAMLGEVLEVPWTDIGHEPAGSINASARDLAQWLIMLLNDGQYGAHSLLKPATLSQLHQPQTVAIHIEQSPFAPLYLLGSPTQFWAYGLGFYIIDYRGQKMVIGGGQIRGMNSLFVLLPALKIAYSILVNVNATAAHFALSNQLADLFMGVEERDWNAEFLHLVQVLTQAEQADLEARQATRQADAAPKEGLEAWAGTYAHRLYGDLSLEVDSEQAILRYGTGYVAPVQHWSGDEYLLQWEDVNLGHAFMRLSLDDQLHRQLELEGIGRFVRQNS